MSVTVVPSHNRDKAHHDANDQSSISVLIVDADADVRATCAEVLSDLEFDVRAISDGGQIPDELFENTAVVLLSEKLRSPYVAECIDLIRSQRSDTQVVVLADSENSSASKSDGVAAVRVFKPIRPTELKSSVSQAVYDWRILQQSKPLEASSCEDLSVNAFSTSLVEQIELIAKIESTVLLGGESGTGKTTIARLVHQSGPRCDGPFVSVNCASLPRDLIEAELFGHSKGAFTGAFKDRAGRAEAADGGTLFLDEIGDLPIELQPKLLTFLQDRTIQRIGSNEIRKVDVRLIVATHQNLRAMCEDRRFRPDLFYRLNVLNLEVPPLRERIDELPRMIDQILKKIAMQRSCGNLQIESDSVHMLCRHDWPGNIRELENVLERASAFCKNNIITPTELRLHSADRESLETSISVGSQTQVGQTLAEIERQAIIDTLKFCNGNKALTARTLGISEKSIYNKMKRHGIGR